MVELVAYLILTSSKKILNVSAIRVTARHSGTSETFLVPDMGLPENAEELRGFLYVTKMLKRVHQKGILTVHPSFTSYPVPCVEYGWRRRRYSATLEKVNHLKAGYYTLILGGRKRTVTVLPNLTAIIGIYEIPSV